VQATSEKAIRLFLLFFNILWVIDFKALAA